jgi:apolipoprotein N-acyltransferase
VISIPTAEPAPVRRQWPGPGALARLLAAPVGGVLLYLACAPRMLWWLAPVGFALLGLALRGRRRRVGFGLGVLFGLGYFVPLLPWIGIYVGALPWLALAGVQALFLGLGCCAIAAVGRLPGAAFWSATLWVATEALSSRVPFGGFPWGKVAFSQADGPLVHLAALGGSPLVSFAVVLTGFGLASLAPWPTPARGSWATGVACVLVAALLALLGATGWLTTAGPGPPPRTVTVAAVQGSVPRLGLDFNAQRRAVLDNHVHRTLVLADDIASGRVPRPDLVIWPENSSDIDPLRNPDAYAEISNTVDRLGVPLLVGAVLVQPDDVHTTNSALVWQPGAGPTQRDDKRRVQPFGEYLPWRGFFRLLSSYADRAGFFVPGHGPGVVQVAGVPVGVAICWEIAFDDLVNDSVRNGAQLLAVPSNNATFGRSEMTFQQLSMSRLRAVEHDRTVVVAATTGVSAIIGPDGVIVQHTPLFVPAALVGRVSLRSTITLATRLGEGPEWVLTLIGMTALGAALLGRRRRGEVRHETRGDRDD